MWWFYTFHTLTNSFWTFQERIASQNDPSNTRIRDVKMWCELHKHLGDSIVSNLPLQNRFTVCMVPSVRDHLKPMTQKCGISQMTFLHPFFVAVQLAETLSHGHLYNLRIARQKNCQTYETLKKCQRAAPLQTAPSMVTSKPSSAKARAWAGNWGIDEVSHVGCDTDVNIKKFMQNIILQFKLKNDFLSSNGAILILQCFLWRTCMADLYGFSVKLSDSWGQHHGENPYAFALASGFKAYWWWESSRRICSGFQLGFGQDDWRNLRKFSDHIKIGPP